VGFRSRFKVRFGDVDPAGIVYYPTLVHYNHVALEDFFADHLGVDYAAVLSRHRIGLPAVRLEMDFHAPLRFGEGVEVETLIERVGTTSVHWRHLLYRQGGDRPVAEARVVTVCVDLERFEKRELPDWLSEAFQLAERE
jgi:4-hydroxybenzoyl-CoA thioesterase